MSKLDGLTKFGKIAYYVGAVNLKEERGRLLHPFSILTLLLVSPVGLLAFFSGESVLDYFKSEWCWW